MSAAQKILLIEKDEALRLALAEQLQLHGEFLCVDGRDSDVALVVFGPAENENIDLACEALRAEGVKAPLLLLSEAQSEAADDFLPKPFRFSALLAMIRAQLRQFEKGDDGVKLGAFEFWPSKKSLIGAEGDRFRLTEKETAILKYLLRTAEPVTGRAELLAQVWGYNSGVTTHTLETHVYRLRRKLGRNENGEEILVTEPGGYRLAQ